MHWLGWKGRLQDLECIMYMFQFVYLSEVKENIKRFFRKDLTSFFYVTSYIWFAASLLVNGQYV